MSKPAFIRAVSFSTLLMAIIVGGAASHSYTWPFSWALLIGTFLGAIAFIFVFTISDNPGVSLIGVAGLSLCLGLSIGPLIATYTSAVVMQAVIATAGVMIVMSLAGIFFPRAFEAIGPYLMMALGLLIVVLFGQILFALFGFEQAVNTPILNQALAWIGVVIFTLFVAYDWAKALSLPRTWDNAIDASGGLILDAVNLFIRFLTIFGRD